MADKKSIFHQRMDERCFFLQSSDNIRFLCSINPIFRFRAFFQRDLQFGNKVRLAEEMKSAFFFRRSRISSQSDFIHRRWIYSGRRKVFFSGVGGNYGYNS